MLWFALGPQVAIADPPAATNFRTAVTAIEPAAPEIDVSIVGGDSFVMIRADRGATVEVTGYQGEPYLRFLPSGEVVENRASVTYFASRSRYGADVPSDINTATPPDWRRVGSDGEYAWHDHRTHWMNEFDPPGRRPGDVILEAAVPLVVDGRPTTVSVTSVWVSAPSPAAAWWGAGIGMLVAAVVLRRRSSMLMLAGLAGAVSVSATALAWWQFRSVPLETGPSWVMPVLPSVAALAAVAAAACARRAPFVAASSLLLAGVELALWTWRRRTHLGRPILPTDAPWVLDRAATTATFVTAVAVMIAAGWGLTARR